MIIKAKPEPTRNTRASVRSSLHFLIMEVTPHPHTRREALLYSVLGSGKERKKKNPWKY